MTPTHTGTYIDFLSTGYSGQTNPLPKLKPCPFCGANPINLSIENDEDGSYFIYCNVCDSCYENANAGLDDLINGWNRRAKE